MSFIFKITTTTSPQTFVIPCVNAGTFNATVDYGDGTGSQTVTAYNDSNLTHSFATAGQHTITIDGTFPNVRFYDDAASRVLIDEVVDLGDVGWVTFLRSFRACTNLTTFNSGTANTSSATGMNDMFFDCSSLTSLDLSNFDTSSVTDISRMFNNCTSLTALDVSNFDTSSVTNMQSMFLNCTSLTALDVTSFDTSSVTTMGLMFQNCSSLTTLNLSNFDTSSVTNMQSMFFNCTSLTSLDLSNFDTSSVTTMGLMFLNCTSLTNLDIKHFDISSVTNGSNFLLNANNALTTTAYDELLEAWAAQDVQPNVAWHFGDAQYTVVNIADWYSPRGASSLSIINNKLVSIADSTATFGAAQQIDNLIVGNAYRFVGTATCSNSSAQVYIRVSPVSNVGSPIFNKQATGSVTANDTFTATATTHYVGTLVTGHAANDTVTIDAGITVKEITNYTDANAASNTENSLQANNSVTYQNIAQDVRDTYTLVDGDWLGSELVVNGDFATDSDWNKPTNCTISNGKALLNGVTQGQQLWQTFSKAGTYEVTFTVLDYVSGGVAPHFHNATFSGQTTVYSNGTYTQTITTTAPSRFAIRIGTAPAVLSIDNVSVKEIIEVAS